MKIAFDTLGCKLNQAETETLAREFIDAGHSVVGKNESPDIYILNTCTVTGTADAKSRHFLRLARRRNPLVRIIVTGCYAERAASDLTALAELVMGNDAKTSLLRQLESKGILKPGSNLSSVRSQYRTRAFVKIQDGCSHFCAYCIVPYVRRREQSVLADKVLAEIQRRVAEGHKEVVLTGTRVGGYADGGLKLADLIGRILRETDIARLRVSSLQPQELTPQLLELWKDARLCAHFHLSLQSGSETVLQRMKRRYTIAQYVKAVELIHAHVRDVAITTDVIVGFPGETVAEFEETYEFCHRMGFARTHVFPFSPRTGTVAAGMPGQVPEHVKKERTRRLLELAAESAARFAERFKGAVLDVLWEQEEDGVWSGVTGNYIRVYGRTDKNVANKVANVRL